MDDKEDQPKTKKHLKKKEPKKPKQNNEAIENGIFGATDEPDEIVIRLTF